MRHRVQHTRHSRATDHQRLSPARNTESASRERPGTRGAATAGCVGRPIRCQSRRPRRGRPVEALAGSTAQVPWSTTYTAASRLHFGARARTVQGPQPRHREAMVVDHDGDPLRSAIAIDVAVHTARCGGLKLGSPRRISSSRGSVGLHSAPPRAPDQPDVAQRSGVESTARGRPSARHAGALAWRARWTRSTPSYDPGNRVLPRGSSTYPRHQPAAGGAAGRHHRPECHATRFSPASSCRAPTLGLACRQSSGRVSTARGTPRRKHRSSR